MGEVLYVSLKQRSDVVGEPSISPAGRASQARFGETASQDAVLRDLFRHRARLGLERFEDGVNKSVGLPSNSLWSER